MTTPNCSCCGRFHKWEGSDVGAPWGHSGMVEEPDDEFWCAACAKKEEEYYVKQGWVPTYWRKPEWTRRVAKRLGLVEVSPKGAAWSIWKKPTNIPEGYEEVTNCSAKSPASSC